MGNAAYVTTGKPNPAGAIYRAPKGTTLPTTALTELDAAFTDLGYCSEDGLKNTTDIDSDTIKAWGRDVVLVVQNSKEDGFQFQLIEAMNVDVLKTVYGSSNVSGTAVASGISVTVNADDMEESAWVIDTILKGNVLKRIVIPCAKITAVGEVSYTDSDAIGYETTLACTADTSGNYHYEYIQSAA